MMDQSYITDLVKKSVFNTILKKKPFIIAANWKMNMTVSQTEHYLDCLSRYPFSERNSVILFPPSPYLYLFLQKANRNIHYGSQNLYFEESGAFTGEISADMAKNLGSTFSIVGHSERRDIFKESDEMICKKVKVCIRSGIRPVLCIGECLHDRKIEKYTNVLMQQLMKGLCGVTESEAANLIIAYEPVWAIGTGESATLEQIEETHSFIRKILISIAGTDVGKNIPILYGGSVNPDNVGQIGLCKEVSGFLIGGASLDVEKLIRMMDIFNEKR